MQIDLLEQAQLAYSILNNSTPYSVAKRAIRSLFETPIRLSRIEIISLRLTVIDSYYSTNMSRRYYGIDDLAVALQKLGDSDDQVSEFFLGYIPEPLSHKEGNQLFNSIYGISKSGAPSKRAQSLISKYAYFQTVFGFPIYDSLAKASYSRLSRTYPYLVPPCTRLDAVNRFFEAISKLNQLTNSYDKLDNLLWLIGKVKEGNLSLIMKREAYVRLLEIAKRVPNYDSLVALSTQVPEAAAVIGQDLCNFIAFAATLK